MQRTIYCTLNTEELIDFAIQRDNATHMEIELAQRLLIAMGMLKDINGEDTGSASEEGRQRAAS